MEDKAIKLGKLHRTCLFHNLLETITAMIQSLNIIKCSNTINPTTAKRFHTLSPFYGIDIVFDNKQRRALILSELRILALMKFMYATTS